MAQRRMFSKEITNSSGFLMMSQSAQNLYFHIGMNADDDGFCEIFTIMRMTESKPDDLRSLSERGLIYVLDSKVCIVRDWHENNQLRSDRYKPSKYLDDPKIAEIYATIMREKIAEISLYNGLLTKWQPVGNQMATQVRIGKDRIDKDRERKPTPLKEEKKTDPEKSVNYLMNIPQEDIAGFIEKYNVTPAKVKEKGEDFYNYCVAKGRDKGFYKNYKAALRNAIKSDFGIRPPQDKEMEERIRATQEKAGISSPYAKELANKLSIKK